jgi:hypothetical protein
MASKEATLWLKIKTLGEEALGRIGAGLETLKEIGVIAFTAITAVVVKSLHAYYESEQATNSLTQAMINNGNFSVELRNKYLEQADALSKLTTYQDDQIVGAEAVLQRYLGNIEVTEELTRATLDLATAKKMDLASAAELVGKSIAGEADSIRGTNIALGSGTNATERMAAAVKGLTRDFGGQAEAAAQGLGIFSQMTNIFNKMFEEIGAKLAPGIVTLVGEFKRWITTSHDAKDSLEFIIESLKFLIEWTINTGIYFKTLGETIGTSLGMAAMVAEAVMNGNFSKIKDIVKLGLADINKQWEEASQRTLDVQKAFDDQDTTNKQQKYDKDLNDLKAAKERESQAIAEQQAKQNAIQLERQIAEEQRQQEIIVDTEQYNAAVVASQIKKMDDLLKIETDAKTKEQILEAKYNLVKIQTQQKQDELEKQNRKSTLDTIAGMQNSNNKTLAAIGKAAALTNIAIETPVAVARALGAFPPPFNFVAAGAVAAAMAAQAANVAGIQLAEGGIVMPRPGGVQATIGEGGQPEAVIPLDKAGSFGLGGGMTVIFNGPVMGDQSQAREFAIAMDRELLKLRQNNESQAFDTVV